MAGPRKKTGGKPRPRGGRVTPPARASAAAPATGRSAEPAAHARRGPRPGLLLLMSVLWFTIGVVVLTSLRPAWRYVPGVAAMLMGLVSLRAAVAVISRRAR